VEQLTFSFSNVALRESNFLDTGEVTERLRTILPNDDSTLKSEPPLE
jgi:hypothetical protein